MTISIPLSSSMARGFRTKSGRKRSTIPLRIRTFPVRLSTSNSKAGCSRTSTQNRRIAAWRTSPSMGSITPWTCTRPLLTGRHSPCSSFRAGRIPPSSAFCRTRTLVPPTASWTSMDSKFNSPRAPRVEKIASWIAFAAVFAWFLRFAAIGLYSWFDGDDLMNLHYYWSRPWSALLKANVFFWSSYYRPGGGLFYRPIYVWFGFHPLPFHIVSFTLLALDFLLMTAVVWKLSGSRWGTLIAVFLIGVNPSMYFLYFDTGAVYDVLAFTFYWGAFVLYLLLRREDRLPGWGGLAAVFALFVLALDSKEIAVSLPAAIGLYEWIWHPPAPRRPAHCWRWISREGRFPAIASLASIG